MPFPMIGIVFDLGDVFHFFLDDIGVSFCCGRVIAMTLFPAFTTLRTFLVVLALFGLALVGRRL